MRIVGLEAARGQCEFWACQLLSHVLTDVDEDVLRVDTIDYNQDGCS
jgi:hypothetical protein